MKSSLEKLFLNRVFTQLLIWTGLSIVSILSLFVYVRFVFEEIAPFPPLYSDQGYYLKAAHDYFDFMGSQGVLAVLKAHFSHDISSLGFASASSLHMSLVGAFLFNLFGASRLGALSIHILSWICLLFVGTAFLNRVVGKLSIVFFFLGLLLSTQFAFMGAGGITDFRMDFPAACWSGIALFLWCWFLFEPRSKKAYGAAFVTGGIFFFRVIAAVYWFPVIGALTLYLWIKWRRANDLRLFIAMPAILLLIGWFLTLVFWDRVFIYQYYFLTHVGQEGSLRGLSDKWASFAYYPMNIWNHDLGSMRWGMYGVGLLAIVRLLSRRVRISGKLGAERSREAVYESLWLCLLSAVCPLVILSVLPQRTPQVTSIVVPAIALGCTLSLMILTRQWSRLNLQRLGVFSFFFLMGTFVLWEKNLVRSAPFQGSLRGQALRVGQVFDAVVKHAERQKRMNLGSNPEVAFLDWVGGFDHNSVTMRACEQQRLSLSFEMVIPRLIFKMKSDDLEQAVRRATAVIVPKNFAHLKDHSWPIMQSVYENFPTLLKIIRSEKIKTDEFKYGEREYELYLSLEKRAAFSLPIR